MKRMALFISLCLASQLFGEVVHFVKRVRVQKSVEVHHIVTKKVPYEECWEEEIPVEEYDEGSDTLGAIIGGAAGGILGHQVGGGSGKTAATVGGAIIGTLVGKNLAERGHERPGYKRVRRCRTRYKESEDTIVEYKNIAKVMGRRIVKYSDRPLDFITVDVTLEY